MSSDNHSIMSELYDYGRKIQEGTIQDQTFCPIIYQAPMDADIWDEAVWHACNPALGDFRSLEEMRMMAARAKRIPAAEATFRNLYLNQPVDAEHRFISSAEWMGCKHSVDIERLRGRKCWGGLDLSSTTDLTALILIFPDDAGSYDVLCWFWVPGDNLADRMDRDRVPYPVWRDMGLIEAPPGKAIDKSFIVSRLAQIASEFDLQGVAYDRWRIEDLKKQLTDEGIEIELIPWGQGFRDMGPAVDSLEAAILNNELRHDHPVLDWNASNAVTVSDPAGARKIAKDRSIDRVDGLVALTMAIGLHKREPEPEKCVYGPGRGLLSIAW
ncbi:MAG: terminase TerL endonuclease subunit [Gammaproteobacteria bacterium]